MWGCRAAGLDESFMAGSTPSSVRLLTVVLGDVGSAGLDYSSNAI